MQAFEITMEFLRSKLYKNPAIGIMTPPLDIPPRLERNTMINVTALPT
jgi:hypothetical protein